MAQNTLTSAGILNTLRWSRPNTSQTEGNQVHYNNNNHKRQARDLNQLHSPNPLWANIQVYKCYGAHDRSNKSLLHAKHTHHIHIMRTMLTPNWCHTQYMQCSYCIKEKYICICGINMHETCMHNNVVRVSACLFTRVWVWVHVCLLVYVCVRVRGCACTRHVCVCEHEDASLLKSSQIHIPAWVHTCMRMSMQSCFESIYGANTFRKHLQQNHVHSRLSSFWTHNPDIPHKQFPQSVHMQWNNMN
jgi:hypothetical protein